MQKRKGTGTYVKNKSGFSFGGTCSMMRSLWSGVSGLKTHQMEMDVIGNNIANVNTTSFKSQATGFQDVLYQTVRQGTGAGDNVATTNASQVGLGSKVGSIYTNITKQGSAVTTNNAFDLMITGDSFFVVTLADGTQAFTRDGSFTLDGEGNLVTQNNGYLVNMIAGQGISGGSSIINERTKTMAGQATSQSFFKGNINKDDPLLGEGKITQLEVFGKDGKLYNIKFKFTDAGDEDDSTYGLSIDKILDENGQKVEHEFTDELIFKYNKHDGTLEGIMQDADSDELMGTNYVFDFGGDAGAISGINIDFTNTTNYANTMGGTSSTIYAYKGDTQGLNKGYPNGELNGISITNDGSIYGEYTNGQTVKISQIIVAQFNNAMGLEKVGDNMYKASLNSGEPIYMDITEDGGYMSSGYLEGSNIDLAKEFTDMITTQRGFQANSRVITTSDEMLQILKGLKR